jgi:hypothetical protein
MLGRLGIESGKLRQHEEGSVMYSWDYVEASNGLLTWWKDGRVIRREVDPMRVGGLVEMARSLLCGCRIDGGEVCEEHEAKVA